ncbi:MULTISPECIES: DUF5081 family protein [Listeria]|uniref:DUF5081 family protein n=1 Tax=Listeria TaxID=1637 RepID=UPI000B58AEFA|nr:MULTISPECIES: DUF5081 family protein [Listeria]
MSTDTFQTEELFLLISAFGGDTLFGLPDRQVFQLRGEEGFQRAYERLLDKQILDETGAMTDGGAIVVDALSRYQACPSFVRLNQFMFGFSAEDTENAYLLVEVEAGKSYRFEVLDKVLILQLLTNHFPLLQRDTPNVEQTFLTRPLTLDERKRVSACEPDERFISMEYFHVEETPMEEENPAFYQQYFVVAWQDKLVAIDVVRDDYKQVSGYWLWNELYRELQFPVKEAL